MSKIIVALLIVACVVHAQEMTEVSELQEAKDECIADIMSVLSDLDTKFKSVEALMDEYTYKDMKDMMDRSVEALNNILRKVRSIDVSKVDPESEDFDEVIDDCKTVVLEGSYSVGYIEDFNTTIFGYAG